MRYWVRYCRDGRRPRRIGYVNGGKKTSREVE